MTCERFGNQGMAMTKWTLKCALVLLPRGPRCALFIRKPRGRWTDRQVLRLAGGKFRPAVAWLSRQRKTNPQ